MAVPRQLPGRRSACPTVVRVTDGYRTLLLLRHAKSDYPPGVADHDRPLAERGIREATLMGEWIRANAQVDAVLCSTATRTRQTLTRTGVTAPVQYVDRLYDSTPGVVIDEINGAASRFDVGEPATLLVVGHEPVMSGLALGLADDTSARSTVAEEIESKFPTSAVAMLRTAGSWAELAIGGAELVDFHIAR